jgi:hypothetical protein
MVLMYIVQSGSCFRQERYELVESEAQWLLDF